MADQNSTPPAPKPVDDAFAAAFSELSKDDGAPVIVPAADAVLDGVEADQAAADAAKPTTIEIEGVLPDPNAVAADGTDPAAKEGSGGAPAAKPAAGEPPKPDPAKDQEMLDRFRQIIAETKPAAPAPAPAAPQPQPSAVSPFTPEEEAAIETYQKDWPDVFAAQEALAKRQMQVVVDHVFTTLRPILAQLQGTTAQIATTTHMEQLHAAVPDITEIAPKMVAWVDTQPDYLKPALQLVVQKGSVAQVVDLVKRFRAETGTAEPAGKVADPAPKPTIVPARPDPAKLAKALTPTKGLRTGVQSDLVQSDDFDGAFAAFSQVA